MTALPTVDLTVYPLECDAFGHLNHASVLALFERARWESLARGAARLLAANGAPVPRPPSLVPLVLDCLGAGYGHPTAAGEAARAHAAAHGLRLDPTYGAKAFAALPALVPRGFRRIVFWHTFAFPVRRTWEPSS